MAAELFECRVSHLSVRLSVKIEGGGGNLRKQKRLCNFVSFYAPGDDSPHGGILLLLCPYVCMYVCMYVCPSSVKVFG